MPDLEVLQVCRNLVTPPRVEPPRSRHRLAVVQQGERPAPGYPLQHGEPGIVLSQREQARQRDAEGAAENRAVAAAVPDDGDRLGLVGGDDVLEGGPGPARHLVETFPTR